MTNLENGVYEYKAIGFDIYFTKDILRISQPFSMYLPLSLMATSQTFC